MYKSLRWMAMSWRLISLPPFLLSKNPARVRSASVRPLEPLDLERKEVEEEEEEATGPADATRRPRLKPPRRAVSAAGAGAHVMLSAMGVAWGVVRVLCVPVYRSSRLGTFTKCGALC